MLNYGEDIAYWYLRLNGFFPLSNFVLHPNGEGELQGDVDLLAVRPPFVYEDIGGQPDDFDPALLGDDPQVAWWGVICEVKTGLPRHNKRVFREDQVAQAVKRLGFVPPDLGVMVAAALEEQAAYAVENFVIAKILIGIDDWDGSPHTFIPLTRAEDFLIERAVKYADAKQRDRMFFPAGAFQFAIRAVERGDLVPHRR